MENGDGRRIKTTLIGKNKEEGDDEEEEEQKIDKFYALIRRYREAQRRLRIESEMLNSSSPDQREKKKMKTQSSGSWIPAFKWEDFNDENQVEFRRATPMVVRTPCNRCVTMTKKHEEEEEEINPNPIPNATTTKPTNNGLGLDLNLSL